MWFVYTRFVCYSRWHSYFYCCSVAGSQLMMRESVNLLCVTIFVVLYHIVLFMLTEDCHSFFFPWTHLCLESVSISLREQQATVFWFVFLQIPQKAKRSHLEETKDLFMCYIYVLDDRKLLGLRKEKPSYFFASTNKLDFNFHCSVIVKQCDCTKYVLFIEDIFILLFGVKKEKIMSPYFWRRHDLNLLSLSLVILKRGFL